MLAALGVRVLDAFEEEGIDAGLHGHADQLNITHVDTTSQHNIGHADSMRVLGRFLKIEFPNNLEVSMLRVADLIDETSRNRQGDAFLLDQRLLQCDF